MSDRAVRRPPGLRPGDRVAVVAPSMPVFREPFERGLEALRSLGFEPEVGAHVHDRHGHLAGTDEARVADLDAALRDPSIRAVWAARGGYGLTRIVDRLDWGALERDPKLLVGFSDVTALHLAAWRRLRLVTVHGPSVSGLGALAGWEDARTHLRTLVTGELGPGPLPALGSPPVVVAEGAAEGRLLGGNLSLLSSTVGTPDQLDARGAVLLLEEVKEAPYRIDRMLTQLLRSGVFEGVAGIVVGSLVGCEPPRDRPSASADEVVAERLGTLGVPVVAGLPLGHVDRQLAVPHGAVVRLGRDDGRLELLEVPFATGSGADPEAGP